MADCIRPYVQILNTSAWLLYACDFEPTTSSAELAAYLFVHGDRMALTGEVTRAAIDNAAYWFGRTQAECDDFSAGAGRSTRPDADAFRALAKATPWLRQLSHETLRPPALASEYLPIPATGLLVRRDLQFEPAALVRRFEDAARGAVSRFYSRLRPADPKDVGGVCDWLVAERPSLLICGQQDRILWDPAAPARLGALRGQLRTAGAAALADIAADLEVVNSRTQTFHRALRNPEALPAPDAQMEHGGYVYLHRRRRLITYNLHEPDLERLRSPAIPYARDMLGARTVHEWAHLAVDAGWVPLKKTPEEYVSMITAVADRLDAAMAAAPAPVRQITASDLRELAATSPEPDSHGFVALTRKLTPTPGLAATCIILRRLPDFQANLLTQRFLTPAERETYVRQNIRELRSEYPPQRLWRMLARYLYEYQYLRFSAVEDRETYFLSTTWFDADFVQTGILDLAAFRFLAGAVGRLCDGLEVDEHRFK
jgi:hypothetical protein